jgi:hypothetical protein
MSGIPRTIRNPSPSSSDSTSASDEETIFLNTKFSPGDVVHFKTSFSPYEGDGVIAYESPEDQSPCPLHDDPKFECWEWANVLAEDGYWYYHISECRMELSEFGEALRGER